MQIPGFRPYVKNEECDNIERNVISHYAYSESSYPALNQNREFAYHCTIKKMAGEMVSTDTANPLMSAENERLKVFLHALLFVAGFSVVFIVGWGGSVTLVGQFFGAYKRIIAQIGGVIVIAFGLATLGVIRLPWFYADTRTQFSGRGGTFGGSALMGIFFAAGWSPCIGATLGAILTMGLSQQTVGQAMWLASGY